MSEMSFISLHDILSLNVLAIKSLSEHILFSIRNTLGNLSFPLP